MHVVTYAFATTMYVIIIIIFYIGLFQIIIYSTNNNGRTVSKLNWKTDNPLK